MTDLFDQLRAYGRQIEADGLVGISEPSEPDQIGVSSEATSGQSAEPLFPAAAESGRRSPGRRFRSSMVLVAAALAGVIVVTSSVLLPPSGLEGTVVDKRTGFSLGMCLLLAGCTSEVIDEAPSTSVSVVAPTPAAPSALPALPVLPTDQNDAPVAPGTYLVETLGVPIEVTVPAGWKVFDDLVLHGPEGATLVFITGAWDVYSNACQWKGTRVDVGPTVQDLVTALIAQEPTINTEPREVTVGRFVGTELVLSAPPDLDFATCWGGSYAIMVDDGMRQTYIESPGQPDTLWIIDFKGQRGIIGTWSVDPMSDATKAQLDAIVASIKIR